MMKTVASNDKVIRPIVAVRISNASSGRSKDVYVMLHSGTDTVDDEKNNLHPAECHSNLQIGE